MEEILWEDAVQLIDMQRELEKQMAMMEAKTDALSARVKEEIEKLSRQHMKAHFYEAFNQLGKLVNSKLEATVPEQIKAQFQTSGEQALWDALLSIMKSSVLPAFEKACKEMFEGVYASEHSLLAHALTLMKLLDGFAEMFKHPTNPISPSEILMAASLSENTNTVDSNTVSSSYVQLRKLLKGFADMEKSNKAVSDALLVEEKKKEEAEHKKKKNAQDEVSSVLSPHVMFKPPSCSMTTITPAEILKAASSSGNSNTVDSSTASSSYVQLRKLLEGFADMEETQERNKAVSDALGVEDPEHKKKKIAQDEVSSLLSPHIMFKHPTHPMTPITPSEILKAASSSENNTASSSYVQLRKLLAGYADVEKRNKAVSDVLVVKDAEHQKKKIAQDEVSSVLSPRFMFKHPTRPMTPITPSEILKAASSSEVDSNPASSYVQLRKLLHGFADMEKRNKAVSDALVVEEAGHKKEEEEAEHKKKKIAEDEVSSRLSPHIMFKHPTHPITSVTPSEILMAAASSSHVELRKLLEGKLELLEGDARVLGMLSKSDVGNPEVEFEGLGDARSTEIDEFGSQRELQNAVSENKENLFCSQTSDLGIGMAQRLCVLSSEFYITKGARQGDGSIMSEGLAQHHSVEKDQEQFANVSGSATATTTSQLQTPIAKSRKQEWKNMQASGPSFPSPGVLNSIESSSEAGGSSSPPFGEAAVPQIMQEMMKELVGMHKELQKQMTRMEKAVEQKLINFETELSKQMTTKEAADQKLIDIQKGLPKQMTMEKAVDEKLINFHGKLQEQMAGMEKAVEIKLINFKGELLEQMKKMMETVRSTNGGALSAQVKKEISENAGSSGEHMKQFNEAFNQLEKSVNSMLEVNVPEQIRALGQQAFQDALMSSMNSSVLPAFVQACRQLLMGVCVDPRIIQLTSVPHEKVEMPFGLLKLVAEGNYDVAFRTVDRL